MMQEAETPSPMDRSIDSAGNKRVVVLLTEQHRSKKKVSKAVGNTPGQMSVIKSGHSEKDQCSGEDEDRLLPATIVR